MDTKIHYSPDKPFWVRPDIGLIVTPIYEYDLIRAGLNILQNSSKLQQMIPKDKLEELYSLPKKDFNIQIGYLRKDSEFSKQFANEFIKWRAEFIKLNRIEDRNILKVNNDSILLMVKAEYPNVINLQTKCNQYKIYFKITESISCLLDSSDKLVMSGLGSEKTQIQSEYWIKELTKLLKGLIDTKTIDKLYISDFISKFTTHNLPSFFYQPLGPDLASPEDYMSKIIGPIAIQYCKNNFK